MTWLHPAKEVQITLEVSLSKGRGPGIFIYLIYLFCRTGNEFKAFTLSYSLSFKKKKKTI